MGPSQADALLAHLGGAGLAALINFPLWKASAIAHSNYKVHAAGWRAAYAEACSPPYRGAAAVVGGMTWARAAIFYGSDVGGAWLRRRGWTGPEATIAPALAVATVVQVVNQPVVRGAVMLQDPASKHSTLRATLAALQSEKGYAALWRGTSAGVAKTVPKYCTAIAVKDALEDWLPRPATESGRLLRSAAKASCSAVCGAILTNPLDVIRNEMFKGDVSFGCAVRQLHAAAPDGAWLARGADRNIVAVAIPVACTLFFTEQFARMQAAKHGM
ncbi:hypothetical protein M885DRAFT_517114 [Pelagophyceae sp. CCMP2097]|nr:hypothetical protein M885DRAFT_517114 [Pelagophyceae sp. CCMP2097]